MAYAPGATAGKKPNRASTNRQTSNGRPGTRPGPTSAGAPTRRPSISFVAGLGIGLAIGAAAALLLAPRSGAETRQALRSRGRKVRNRAGDVWDDLRIELEATRRALRRKKRDAKVEIAEEQDVGGRT